MPEKDNDKDNEQDGGIGFTKYVMYISIPLIIFILGIFLVGVLLAVFSDPEDIAFRIAMVRDVFIIIMVLEGIMIIVALVILTLQVTRLIVILRNETSPIMENARETVETAKGTARFVSKNLVGPIVSLQAFMAAFVTFVREIGGIRRAIRHQPVQKAKDRVDNDE